MSLRVLAISSSRVGKSGYLQEAALFISRFLGNNPLNIAFIPYAAVDGDYEAYAQKVRLPLQALPYKIEVAEPENARSVIEQSDVIMVGGGNTFKLLHDIYELGLFEIIQQKVNSGTPYIGWSAGSNIAGKTIGTTNDMPIIEPKTFEAFGFLPFQINPHYINVKPENHNGETRDERLSEFMKLNPNIPVIGLPEGAALKLEDGLLTLIGEYNGVLFQAESGFKSPVRYEVPSRTDLSYLL